MEESEVLRDSKSGNAYRIVDFLGEGGFGTVFKCVCLHDPWVGHVVAIKRLDKARLSRVNLRARVVEEVRVHARLDHPSILGLEHVYEDEAHINLVLDYCSGGDLTRALKSRGRFHEEEARNMIAQVAEGLNYLHKHNILHRDITMSNIMITESGRYKIGDFGLAKSLATPTETHRTLCGTPNAISPEVALKRPYGLLADVWGLGVILYTVLVGKSPFDDGRVKSTLQKVIHQNPEFPPDLSPNAVHLITGMLQKDECKRLSLSQVLQHPFLAVNPNSLCSSLTGDSGIGTTTLTNTTNQSQSVNKKWPDIRQPLLGHLSEVVEDVHTMGSSRYISRPKSATPSLPSQTGPGPLQTGPRAAMPYPSLIKPRSVSTENVTFQSCRPTSPLTSSSSNSKPSQPLCPPLCSVRLRPSRTVQTVKPGVTGSILGDGRAQFHFELTKKSGQRVREKVTVSRDGLSIEVERDMGSTDLDVQEYKHYTLPRSYWLKYNLICRFVQCLRETTPKITLYVDSAQCYLMENLPTPNFEVLFDDGPKITYSAKSGTITFTYNKQEETFSYPLTKSITEDRLRYLRCFEEWHSQCKTLEKMLSDCAKDLSAVFPAIFGRRSKSTSSSPLTNNRQNQEKSMHLGHSAYSTSMISNNFSPSSVQPDQSRISCISKQSSGRGTFREYRFSDGTLLQIPKDSRDEICYYMNSFGQWENNENGPSSEMKLKLIQAMRNTRSMRMFCADYIASFFLHGALSWGNLHMTPAQLSSVLSPELKEWVLELKRQPHHHYVLGGLSGLLSALLVYPFDFVRRGVMIDQTFSFRTSLSTVPYATVFFGLYFHQRDPNCLKSQCLWASGSAFLAACAEVPFDKAKLAMMGNRRVMIMASSLYVPFGALMLVMYDKALLKYQSSF